ncbi:MAG: EAL domain-containing protein [Mesorhizobium sp.]
MVVGVMDLDGFKPVNDLYGHTAGDALLVQVAQRLSELCSSRDIHVARLGGDEFALSFLDLHGCTDLMVLDEEVCALLNAPFLVHETETHVTGTVGFAEFPQDATSHCELFEYADYALFYGKRTARGQPTLSDESHKSNIRRDAMIERALVMPEIVDEMRVVFQPIVKGNTGHPIAFEALARWQSARLGEVSPSEFIPIAERAGLVGKITRLLLEKALHEAAKWPEDLRLSFNLSAHDLGSHDVMLSVISIIGKSGVAPGRIDFEFTESAFAHDFLQVERSIQILSRIGCGISLDDFGTGYSSLSRLHSLPFTKIKIDRSFVVDIHRKPASAKIIRSLLALSKDMGLECVVEGVETVDQLEALRKLGDTLVQGQYYSLPLGADQVGPYLTFGSAQEAAKVPA